MAKALSIHIGLNGVDPAAYGGWAGTLAGCVNDANSMKAIAESLGYTPTLLLNQAATSSAVIQAIGGMGQQLGDGDILFISYSGHGGIVDDATGGEPGDGGKDETWVLYDRELLDDELEQLWSQFAQGVRVFVVSDSCHSGTVVRDYIQPANRTGSAAKKVVMRAAPQKVDKLAAYMQIVNAGGADAYRGKPVFRMIPDDVQAKHYEKFKDVYTTRQYAALSRSEGDTGATVLLISGCQDNQLSADGTNNGLFTEKLLEVWNNGSFAGTYHDFHNEIRAKMPPTQTPNFFMTGPAYAGFEEEQPWAIDQSTQGGNTTSNSSSGGGGRPTVQGPDSADRGDSAPSFTVNVNGNKYYVVEVATDSSLFGGEGHTEDNFYATWEHDANNHIDGAQATWTLPSEVWSKLNAADNLYYRVISTSSVSGWDNYMYSTYDTEASGAPSIQITGSRAAKAARAAAGKKGY